MRRGEHGAVAADGRIEHDVGRATLDLLGLGLG